MQAIRLSLRSSRLLPRRLLHSSPRLNQLPRSGKSDDWDFLEAGLDEWDHDLFAKSPADATKAPAPVKARRALHTDHSNTMTTTEKEKEIFSRILDSILDEKDHAQRKSSRQMSSVQALFEPGMHQGDKPQGHDLFGDVSNVKLELATEDVRNIPLSYGSLIRQRDHAEQAASIVAKQQAEEHQYYQELLSPILEHIDSLQTDQEVADYFITKVANRFKPDMMSHEQDVDKSSISVDAPIITRQSLPIYLLKCIQVLRQSFDEAALAISLFERAKQQGIEFYACACSVDVYNEVIQLRWDYYQDVYAVESLVSEMHVNAVQGSAATTEILGRISRDAIDARNGLSGVNGFPLWSKEDEERVHKLNQYRLRITATLASLDGFTLPFVA